MNYMVALDGSRHSEAALETALEMVDPAKDRLHLVAVVEERSAFSLLPFLGGGSSEEESPEEQDRRARRLLVRSAKRCERKHAGSHALSVKEEGTGARFRRGQNLHLLLTRGQHVGWSLCRVVEKKGIDCLIIGRRGLTGFQRAMAGSTSRYCMENAECNVYVVKGEYLPEKHDSLAEVVDAEEKERRRRMSGAEAEAEQEPGDEERDKHRQETLARLNAQVREVGGQYEEREIEDVSIHSDDEEEEGGEEAGTEEATNVLPRRRPRLELLVRCYAQDRRRRANHRRAWQPQPTEEQSRVAAADGDKSEENGTIKRRVALSCAYIGTNYEGSQKNNELRTIDSELEKALYRGGFIHERNYGDIKKIGWRSSSRTDRGVRPSVHAAMNILSMKLEVKDVQLLENNPTLIVDRVNQQLPSDIRVLAIQKVGRGFDARANCKERHYEYLVPARLLQPVGSQYPTTTTNAIMGFDVEKCKRVMRHFEGTHQFFNFGKAKLLPNQKARVLQRLEDNKLRREQDLNKNTNDACTENQDNGDNDIDDDEDDDNEQMEQVEQAGMEKDPIRRQQLRVAEIEDYVFNILKQRTVTSFTCDLLPAAEHGVVSFADQAWVRFKISGESFVRRQIRKMMGCVVGIMQDCFPEDILPIALDGPFRFKIPYISGTPLLLSHSEWWPKSQLDMSAFLARSEEESRRFKTEQLYPHIMKAYQTATEREIMEQLAEPNTSMDDLEELIPIFHAWKAHMEEKRKQRRAKEGERKERPPNKNSGK
ncbi:tRNA pseudouridine synthase 1 [Balamuthia mandrillaris]